MTEIKSTLDLIMEKTKHMSLNEEERRKIKQEELEERIKVATFRFIKDGRGDHELLVDELKRVVPEDRQEAKKISLSVLVKNISPSEEDSHILRGIADIMDSMSEEKVQAVIEPLRREFKSKEEDLRKEAMLKSYDELDHLGIRGSAIVPRIEGSRFWQEGYTKLIDSFRKVLLDTLNALV